MEPSILTFLGKTVVVTGAGSGIGRQMVKCFEQQGAIVYAVTKTDAHLLKLTQECPTIIPIQCDLRNWDETEKALAKIDTPVDYLVNNAGIATVEPFFDITSESFDEVFNVNVKGAVNVCKIVAKKMIEGGRRGSIVNISSLAAHKAAPGFMLYGASKAALDAITKSLAVELGPHEIRVNSVNPTVVMTELGKALFKDPANADPILSRTPLGRFAEVQDVINSVVFLLSSKASMITGECLLLDGGFFAY